MKGYMAKTFKISLNVVLLLSIIVFVLVAALLYVLKSRSIVTMPTSQVVSIDGEEIPSTPSFESTPSEAIQPGSQAAMKDDAKEFMDMFVSREPYKSLVPKKITFQWNTLSKSGEPMPNDISGYSITFTTNDSSEPGNYLTSQGFEVDHYNVADGTLSSLEGYKKDGIVCKVDLQSLNINGDPPTKITLSCAQL